jgi:hypothetical protein
VAKELSFEEIIEIAIVIIDAKAQTVRSEF